MNHISPHLKAGDAWTLVCLALAAMSLMGVAVYGMIH